MARPHTEFIFAQSLPWEVSHDPPGRGGLRLKLLSCDDVINETTAIFELPAGCELSVTSPFQEEIYVLDGALEIAGEHLARDGYFRLPSNVPHQWSAKAGAVVLLFTNVPTSADDTSIIAIDAVALDWSTDGVPVELDFMRLARKPLFVEALTGKIRTWLLSVAPQVAPRGDYLAVETHACAEEVLMLSGDITGPLGEMTPGAYFWRPRDTLHGPFGSRNGGMAISRWRDGEPVTTFHGGEVAEFTFEAPYVPVLDSAKASAKSAPNAAERF